MPRKSRPYHGAKRQKEKTRQARQEEKRRRRLERRQQPPQVGDQAPGGLDSPQPQEPPI